METLPRIASLDFVLQLATLLGLWAIGALVAPAWAESGPITAGASHSCRITPQSGVECWGNNTFGQLGDGTINTDRLTPVAVTGLGSGVQAIAAGSFHTCALTTAGALMCWGSNGNGQLGDGTTTNRRTPVLVIGLGSGAQAIAAGNSNTCALTTAGAVQCWGSNGLGQLGDGTTTQRPIPNPVTGLSSGVQAIAAGSAHTCALTTAGAVQCWGRNISGQLGDGTTTGRLTPVPVTGLSSGVQAIAAGSAHTCALTTAGAVQCWGRNISGQLGDGTTTGRLTPDPVTGLSSGVQAIAAGSAHTCALTAAGAVQCWGSNNFGQLGDGTITDRLTPVPVTGLGSGVQAIAAGSTHTCALTTTGAMQCWGNNFSGQLGDGTTARSLIPVPVSGLGSGVQAIAAGYQHTCAVTTAGAVQCWGANDFGQLGDGTLTQRKIPVSVPGLSSGMQAIAAGEFHTCALTMAGAVQCWGRGDDGQLGDGLGTTSLTPIPVTGLGSGVQAIEAGDYHTCALTTAGAVQCWGYNLDGQLGDGTITDRLTPVPVTDLGSGVQAIAAGGFHTCALSTAGAVQCWGDNLGGQLGDGTITDRLTPVPVTNLNSGVQAIAAGDYHACALTTAGAVQCWGSGRLGDGTSTGSLTPVPVTGLSSGVQAIAAGAYQTCALSTSGAVQCWGFNANGQLGDGSTANRSTPVPVVSLSSGVQAISAGGFHTCALTTAGAAHCWGAATSGQLGNIDVVATTPRPVLLSGSGAVTPGITLRGPITADQDDRAGTSVAIGDDAANETIIIGAPGTAAGGAVYLYLRSSSSLTSSPSTEKAAFAESFAKNIAPAVELAPPVGGGIGDKFGQAVATSPDGSSIAVGAPLRAGGGSVFVFREPELGWDSGPPDPPLELMPPAPGGGIAPQAFGDTLAYAADGTLIVGAPSTDVGQAIAAGAAFAYLDNGISVVPISGALTAGTPQANAGFGAAVAADNGLIAIGAPDENDGALAQQGAAYLFATSGGGVGTGTRIQPVGGQIGDKFGTGIALDDGIVVVGAPGDDTTAGTDSGSARLFRPGTGGVYNETSILLPANGDDQGAGTAVAARSGNILLGAPLATAFDKPQAGRAYLYLTEDQQSGVTDTADAILENQTGDTGDQFGSAVAIGRKRLAVGVPSDTEPDSAGVAQQDIGRTDTFILDGILRSGFE